MFRIKIIIALLCFLTFLGCDDTLTEDTLPEIPDSNVSFSKHLQPVFELKCVGCHNESQKEGGLSLTTWSSTTNDPGVVFPGNPDNSRLVWSIEGRAGVNPMPPIGSAITPFTAKEVKGVRTWITEGALNN
jgi:hypothetical protein